MLTGTEQQDLQEMLSIMSRQSERIDQMKATIDRLNEELQKKDSQLSEALTIAEQYQAKARALESIEKENRALKQKLMESDTRIDIVRQDYEKQISQLKAMLHGSSRI